MKRFLRYFLIFFILITFTGPIFVLCSGQVKLNQNWRVADRSSAHLAPDPKKHSEAIVEIYSARAFNWRGLFAVHTWIAAKPKNSQHYIIFQALGWNLYFGHPIVYPAIGVPDASWYGHKPKMIFDLRGKPAELAIQHILEVTKTYPYKNKYILWPGPNSNTYVAYVIRHVPEIKMMLPVTAIGKDFLSYKKFFARALSQTGYQFSLWGALGITIAKVEGIEFNILGSSFGISFKPLSIHIPGVG